MLRTPIWLFPSQTLSMYCPAVAAVVIQTPVIVPDYSSLFLIWVVQNVSWPGAINSGDGAIDSSSNPFQRQECPRQLLAASTWMMGAPRRPSLTFSHSRSVSVALIGHSQPSHQPAHHTSPHLTSDRVTEWDPDGTSCPRRWRLFCVPFHLSCNCEQED